MTLELFFHIVASYFGLFLGASWDIFRSAAPYMLFGFSIAGMLHVFIRADKIGGFLGCGRFRPVFLSALIGIPLPLCSCGVIPAAAGLRKQGASRGATLSFLISTPESGIDSISVSYALLDPMMTIARPIVGFFTAMVAGIMETFFGRDTTPDAAAMPGGCGCGVQCGTGITPLKAGGDFSEKTLFNRAMKNIASGARYAFDDLLGDVGKWFLIGILIAGGITLMIPDTLFSSISDNRLIAMLIAMAAGLPMYVCATSSTPIAAALILKGLNPGAALVFLLLGPATNIASISMVYGLLGKRSLFIYLGSMIGCALAFGFMVDGLYAALQITPTAVVGQASEIIPEWVELGASILLGALLIYSIAKRHRSRHRTETSSTGCATCPNEGL